MSNMGRDKWAEKQKELLDNDVFNYLDNQASDDFLTYLEFHMHKALFQKYLNEWLETPQGLRWYEKTLDKMISDVPEND